jgi:Lipase (class 3)
MKWKPTLIAALALISSLSCFSQSLKPGFDAREYLDLLTLTQTQQITKDTSISHYELLYSSPEMGLKNRWYCWLRDDHVGIVSIRGTVSELPSWLENFYAAMIPAKGSIQVNDSTTFHYKLAENPDAAVHTGWTIGLAFLGPDIVEKIKKLHSEKNINQFLIFGHSQGGALAFLTTSYLYYLQKNGELPAEISFKTYCSAAPKPGNLYYAYDFDFITRGSRAFTIVNADDWVPETPFSAQTLKDFNSPNPFENVHSVLGKQKMLARWYLKGVYNKMDNASMKSKKRFEKTLGKKLYPMVKKTLPQLKEPIYAGTMNYMRAGIPIVLQTDSSYHELFKGTKENIFLHHRIINYKYLVQNCYPESGTSSKTGD